MKNRTNQILLAVTIVTAVLYAFFLVSWLELLPFHLNTPFRYSSLGACLGVGFHIVPCFCLQFLLCRAAKGPVPRLIPLFLLVVVAAVFAMFLSTATGWDIIWWGLMLVLCAAPAAGCILAWGAYGVQRLRRFTNE